MKCGKFKPVLFDCLQEGITPARVLQESLAGLMVAIVALPLAIAFAIASGVRPEQGLYTAIVAGAVIAFFGGCRVQVSGPTGAFIALVAAIVLKDGYQGLAAATLLAGVLILLMGLLDAGRLIRFIPETTIYGFTAAIAVIIATSQLPNLSGVAFERTPEGFADRIWMMAERSHLCSPASLLIAGLAVAGMLLIPRWSSKLPAALLTIVALSLLAWAAAMPVETIGSCYGQMPSGIPELNLPVFPSDPAGISSLCINAISIALLASIESALSAKVADNQTGDHSRLAAEFNGLGLGNIAAVLVGGIPATGAFVRTASNIQSGARTPIAAIVHAVVLLCVLFWLGGLASAIPLSALGGILLVVAYRMAKVAVVWQMLRHSKEHAVILSGSFLGTLLIDLIAGLAIGIVTALSVRLFGRFTRSKGALAHESE